MSLTARDVTEMLRRHYLPEGRQPGGIFATEIGSPVVLPEHEETA